MCKIAIKMLKNVEVVNIIVKALRKNLIIIKM